MLVGTDFEFRWNGTGQDWHWGCDDETHTGSDGTHKFKWRSVGPCRILVQHPVEGAVTIHFDFLLRRNEYDYEEVCLIAKGLGEAGHAESPRFWNSSFPLVYEDRRHWLTRIINWLSWQRHRMTTHTPKT